jgi:hypothetical protein
MGPGTGQARCHHHGRSRRCLRSRTPSPSPAPPATSSRSWPTPGTTRSGAAGSSRSPGRAGRAWGQVTVRSSPVPRTTDRCRRRDHRVRARSADRVPHHQGPVRPTGSYDLQAGDGGTVVTFRLAATPGGVNKLMAPMVAKTMKSEVAALAELKRVLRVGVREPRSGTCLTLGDRCSAGGVARSRRRMPVMSVGQARTAISACART